jgi:hypothetical protein
LGAIDIEDQGRDDGGEGHHQRRALALAAPTAACGDRIDHAVDAAGHRGEARDREFLMSVLQQREHIIGVSVSETTADVTTAIVSVSANSRNMRPDQARHEQQRDEHGDQRHRQRNHREADFPGALQRRLHRGLAVLHVADDVLDHHDGVVDHETGADRQRHQRQIVEAEAGKIHDAERGDQRQRQRHAAIRWRAASAGTTAPPASPAPRSGSA